MEMKKEYFQWDVNQYIPIKDKYCDFVVNGEVWRLEAENEKVRIPDECFQTHGFKIAYICYEDGTKFAFGFYVKERPAPPEYAYTESEKITFQSLVNEVNELIDDLTSKTENGYFDGKDYVLTEADKEYIASLVHVEGSENYEELRNDLTELDNTIEHLSNEIVTEIDEATDLTRLAYDIPGDEIEIPSMEDLSDVSEIVAEIDDATDNTKLAYDITNEEIEIPDMVEFEDLVKRLDNKVEGERVNPIYNSVDVVQTYDTAGCPKYINDDELSNYSLFGLTESGWYSFVRIKSRYGESVSEGFSVIGASGVIMPAIGSNHVDVAIRFGVIAESQKITVNWGSSSETFVFKATDLAIRNLDYRVTFYLYDIDDYCEWEYALTTDTKFVKDKGYYTLIDGHYVKQEVTVDGTIPAGTYYCHKSLVIKDFTRNMSYTLGTIIDCPVTIQLPEVGGDNYGAWFEVQMNFLQTYSVTIIPHEEQKVSANGVHSPKAGINIINILYHKPTNTWLPTVTNWAVATA